MKELTLKEEISTYAGAGITSTLLNTFLKGFNIFTDLGRYLGSSIRRIINDNLCDF